MKFLIFFIAFICFNINVFGAEDSVEIDKKRIGREIKKIKKKLEPTNYFLNQESFSKEDITYYFPAKVLVDDTFDIEIRWKGELIFIYEIEALTYKTKSIIDLR